MPIYHFNVRDGSDILDTDGTNLPNLRAARVEAVKLAGRLLMDEPDTFWEGSDWHVEVTNHHGVILFRLDFTATDAVLAPPDLHPQFPGAVC
jgi:hypothetical protein